MKNMIIADGKYEFIIDPTSLSQRKLEEEFNNVKQSYNNLTQTTGPETAAETKAEQRDIEEQASQPNIDVPPTQQQPSSQSNVDAPQTQQQPDSPPQQTQKKVVFLVAIQ